MASVLTITREMQSYGIRSNRERASFQHVKQGDLICWVGVDKTKGKVIILLRVLDHVSLCDE